jgi:hypothetical protein
MALPKPARRSSVLLALALFASLLSCGRELTGPGGGRLVQLSFAPHFETAEPTDAPMARNVASLVPFERVRIVLRRGQEIVVNRTVDFPANVDTVALRITVEVDPEAGTSGETFDATLDYLNADDVVVFSGTVQVTARAGVTSTTPIEVAVAHVGPGSNAVRVELAPDTIVATSGQVAALTAVAYDAQDAVVGNAVIGFVAADPTRITVPDLAVGSITLSGVRGGSWVFAQLVSGARDSVWVDILPRPSALTKVSGDLQSTLQGAVFAQPLRVRATAADGLGVADWPISFAVTAGSGLVNLGVVETDADGYAQVTWTAGNVAGPGAVTASIPAPALSAVFTGTQLTTSVASLVFEVQPTNIVAGQTLPIIQVSVRNGANQVMTEYSGAVTLGIDGGTPTANLLGTTSVNAVEGVATFPGLTLDRAGVGYRLLASSATIEDVPSVPFTVTAAPPATIVLVSGGGQSAPPSTALSAPIVVEVRDQFGFVVPGVTVTFAVIAGGGNLTTTSVASDAAGRASTSWSLGASGTQTIRASAGAATPLDVSATVVGAGGAPQLFAAFDYTYLPVGRAAQIPVYLSTAAETPTTVTLTGGDTTASWATGTVEIPAGQTSAVALVTGHFVGTTMMHLTSAFGDDSVLVYVDSAWVDLVDLDYNYFAPGDTIRTQVYLSDPAPAGGLTVTVTSLDPTAALVAPGSGNGAPVPGCLSALYCYSGGGSGGGTSEVRVVTGRTSALLAPPAATAEITIPEGHVYGQLVVLVVGDPDLVSSADVQVTAPGHTPGAVTYYIQDPVLTVNGAGNTLTAPMGLGQVMRAYVYSGNYQPTQDRKITFTSANPAVVTVDTAVTIPRLEYTSPEFAIVSQGIGSTYIRMESPGAPTDSFPVSVANPRVLLEPSTANGAVHGRTFVNVWASSEGQTAPFARATDLPFRVYSNNPAVVQVEGEGGVIRTGTASAYLDVRFVGPGDAYLVVEAVGHPLDSVYVQTYIPGFTMFTVPLQVGIGLEQELQFGPSGGVTDGGSHALNITSSNPAVLRVLTPTLEMSAGTPYPVIRVAGVSEGSADVSISGTGFSTSQFPVQVTATSLVLAGIPPTVTPDSALQRTVAAFLASGSYSRTATDTVRALLRSSNPAAVRVVDSLVTFFPGDISAGDVGRYIAVQPGSAQLTLVSDGLPDAPAVNVTVLPYQLTVSSSPSSLGVGVALPVSIARNSPTADALPVTVVQEGVGAVSIRGGSVSIPAATAYSWFVIDGVTPGALQLIVQAAGHLPDTLNLLVASVNIEVEPDELSPSAGMVDEYVDVVVQVGESSSRRAPSTAKRFVITSSDTTIARVEQDTVRYAADAFYADTYAAVRYRKVGNVTLTATDVDGLIPPTEVDLYVEAATLTGSTYYADDALVMGMNQRTYDYEVYVERPDESPEPLVVTLTASAPGIIDLPATVTIPAGERYWYFNITALNAIGSVRVTASAPGWNAWQFDVFVTRSMFGVSAPNLYAGEAGDVELYFMDALTWYSRPMAVPIPVRVRSQHPGIALAAPDTVIIPAGEFYPLLPDFVAGVAVGTSQVTVEDTRAAVNDLILPAGDEVEVFAPTMRFSSGRYLATPGLRGGGNAQYIAIDTPTDSLWIRFTSIGGRVAVPDSLLLQTFGGGSGYLYFDLEGVTAGLDSIVIAADGLLPDTALVLVGPGILQVNALPTQTLVVGDSVQLTISLLDQAGYPGEVTVAQTIDFDAVSVEASDGTTNITSVVVPVSGTSFTVWVRANTPAADELILSGPNFRTLRIPFTTRAIP